MPNQLDVSSPSPIVNLIPLLSPTSTYFVATVTNLRSPRHCRMVYNGAPRVFGLQNDSICFPGSVRTKCILEVAAGVHPLIQHAKIANHSNSSSHFSSPLQKWPPSQIKRGNTRMRASGLVCGLPVAPSTPFDLSGTNHGVSAFKTLPMSVFLLKFNVELPRHAAHFFFSSNNIDGNDPLSQWTRGKRRGWPIASPDSQSIDADYLRMVLHYTN